jgi:hypothetical protein
MPAKKNLETRMPRANFSFRQFEAVENIIGSKHQHRIGVVGNVVHIVGLEVGQYWHNNRAVSDGAQKGYAPVGRVFPDKGNFVAAFQPESIEQACRRAMRVPTSLKVRLSPL